MGLRLSEAKTRVSHIDEGLDFLGFRIQRRLKPGTTRRVVYTYPSIGIWDFNSDPGLVWLRPRNCILARSVANRRSMVAGDIATSSAAVSSE